MSDVKRELRRSVLEQRGRLDEHARRLKSEAICERILAELREIPALMRGEKAVFLFMPFGHETDVLPVAEWCWSRGIPVMAPKPLKEPRRLRLHRIEGKHQLIPGLWGIPEPAPEAPMAEPGEIAAVIVPGVAFDRSGGRLGYGGGYYDRFFASLRELGISPLKLAPAFDLQLAEHVPMERHDERMDLIVTETARIEPQPQSDRRDR
jgi:5-formyltetrahydrofolate cyclo-ligase